MGRSHLGTYYEAPEGIDRPRDYLAGSLGFMVTEMEVFQVLPRS